MSARHDLLRSAEFIHSLAGHSRADDVITALRRYLHSMGIAFFAVADLVNRRQPQMTQDAMLLASFPQDWMSHYHAHEYYYGDALVLSALSRRHPFYWRDIRRRRHGLAARILDEARAFGLRDGLCIPIHRKGRVPGVINLAQDRLFSGPYENHALTRACTAAVFRIDELRRPPAARRPHLSRRERDILTWIASGRSVPPIAEALSLSEHTVRDYLKTAMGKLNATTQAQAVALGMRLGEIRP